MFSKSGKLRNKINKIKAHEENLIKTMNQPISISDLYIRYDKRADSFGESRSPDEMKKNRIDRLIKHIDSIAEIAKKEHEQFCQNKKGELKYDMENHVTRIILNEFSLYTNNPLCQDRCRLYS